MLKDGIMTLTPLERNFKKGFASLSNIEYEALQDGEVDLVVVVDRETKDRINLEPNIVKQHMELHKYRRKGFHSIWSCNRFNFNDANKQQTEQSQHSVSF